MTDRSGKRTRRLWLAGASFAALGAALTLAAYVRKLDDDMSSLGSSAATIPITDTGPVRSYPAGLARQLRRMSPFDVAVGDVMGDVVPIGDVGGETRVGLRALWERVIAPEFLPHGDGEIEWRKTRWSEVRWEERRGKNKIPTPPSMDSDRARGLIDGSPVVVGGSLGPNGSGWISTTISLSGDDRLYCGHSRLPGSADQDLGPVIANNCDKSRLLAILTTVFRFPWKTTDDFEVLWRPRASAMPPLCLRIESTRRRQPGQPKDWFDEVSLANHPGDPQKLSIGVSIGP